ncbi:hypothetical protein FS837_005927 [Tulasnella sp. UAMH 9824]|nr:hypothetical protein FS837_005927 [Tulasnella sp. UAMH 9824]
MPPPKKRQKVDGNGCSDSILRSATLLDFFQPSAGATIPAPARTSSSISKGKQKAVPPIDDADVIIISDDEEPQLQPHVAGSSSSGSSNGVLTSSDVSPFDESEGFVELVSLNPDPSTTNVKHTRTELQLPPKPGQEPRRKARTEGPVPQRECTPPPPEPQVLDQDMDPVPNPVEKSVPRFIQNGQETQENEWLNEDDEVIELDDDSDGEEGYFTEDEKLFPAEKSGDCLGEIVLDKAESSSTCPVCSICVDGWSSDDLSKHVNACLDSPPTRKPQPIPRQDTSSRVPSKSSSKPPLSESSNRGPNAFSLLMSSRKENEAWKLAEVDLAKPDSAIGKARRSEGRRKAPFYKVLQGMPIAVDAFRYGKIPGKQTVNAGDSGFNSPYVGSKKVFRYLHCGDFRASPRHVLHPTVKGYKLDIVYLDTTYLNAKYCFPPQKQVIEACAELARNLVNKGDSTALAGPSQPSVGKWLTKVEDGAEAKPKLEDDLGTTMDETEDTVKEEDFTEAPMEEETFDPGFPTNEEEEKPDLNLLEDDGKSLETAEASEAKRILVAIGTYSIGKERIVKAVAKALDSKVYCDTRKRNILLCQDDPDLHSLLTNDPKEAQVHLVPLQTINLERIEPYFTRFRGSFSSVIGFRPTGWTYSAPAGADLLPSVGQVISRPQKTFTSSSLNPMRNSNAKYRLYGVPYSEHSSFYELTCFALSVDVVKIIATVNVGSAKSRGMMNKWFEKWEAERKKRAKEGKPSIVPYRCLDYW